MTDVTVQNVPYFAQNDSRWDGYRYCFSHAVAMLLGSISTLRYCDRALKNGYTQPENYYISKLLSDGGETTHNADHLYCLKKHFAIDAYFTTTASPQDLRLSFKKGYPVPIGVAYKSDGHWMLAKGTKGSSWLINDPYGIRDGSASSYSVLATDENRAGENDTYSQSAMNQIFWDDATDPSQDAGWAIFVTTVSGVATGIPEGL
ncbi:MAG: hypothetical protein LH702_09030 [Phormidesmis sp. CAN_BIN44]|nr:hypothetical protein [Phormidesmis sp. CAN_BIN44]